MKIKTEELTGAALDWAVAKCEGRKEPEVMNNFPVAWFTWGNTHYSSDWAHGGPIIERENISLAAKDPLHDCWAAMAQYVTHKHEGQTPLIAAMRCYVASKLGAEIELPEELA